MPNASATGTPILTSTTSTVSGFLTATNILYSKSEIDNLLTLKATCFLYVDGHLLLKANQSTTYTPTEVDIIAAAKLDASAFACFFSPSRTLMQPQPVRSL